MKILKTEQCPSLSGKSTLKYNVGTLRKEIHFNIAENSGSGVFSKEWVSLKNILKALPSANKPFTSKTSTLEKVFVGKSVNSSGFLLAVLIHEGLVGAVDGKMRTYRRLECDNYMPEVTE